MTSITNTFTQGPQTAQRVGPVPMSPLQQHLGAAGGGAQPTGPAGQGLLQQFQAGINPYFPGRSMPQAGGQAQPAAPTQASPMNFVPPVASPGGGGLVRRGQAAPARQGSYNSFLQSALSGGGMGA